MIFDCREHKKMKMEMEDLKILMRTIINMKVTREIQAVSFEFVCRVLTKL